MHFHQIYVSCLHRTSIID